MYSAIESAVAAPFLVLALASYCIPVEWPCDPTGNADSTG